MANSLYQKTGLPRGPERFGVRKGDELDELRKMVQDYKLRADLSDPEQAAVLKEMIDECQTVERARGLWEKRGLPGVSRDWNAPYTPGKATPPEALPEYKAYKDHLRRVDAYLALSSGPSTLSSNLLDDTDADGGNAADDNAELQHRPAASRDHRDCERQGGPLHGGVKAAAALAEDAVARAGPGPVSACPPSSGGVAACGGGATSSTVSSRATTRQQGAAGGNRAVRRDAGNARGAASGGVSMIEVLRDLDRFIS